MKYELEPDNRNCPDNVLLDDLRAVASKLALPSLSKDQYNIHGRFSAATFQNRFGSWNRALEQSGLSTDRKRRYIPHGELLEDIKRVASKFQTGTLSVETYKREGNFSSVTLARAYGSWVKALEAAGLQVSTQYFARATDDDLLSNMATVWEVLGRQPKKDDLRPPMSQYSAGSYTKRFGSWRTALETFVSRANEGLPEPESTTPELGVGPAPTPKPRTPRDPSWRLRFLVNRRDRFSCRACGRSPASEVGVILHVDHVNPWSKGGDTVMDNLQTLCERCNIGKADLSMGDNGA